MNRPHSFAFGTVFLVVSLATALVGHAGVPSLTEASAPPQEGFSADWISVSTAPDRWWAATTFMPSTCEVLAYGGDSFDASGHSTLPRSTLIYQPGLDRWISLNPQRSGGPPSLFHAGLSWDPSHGIAVLFGGSSGGGFSNATFAFGPSSRMWTTLIGSMACTSSTCPSARRMHAQAWSTVAGAVLVFGGNTGTRDSAVTNDLWALRAFPGKRGTVTWKWVLLRPTGDLTHGMPPARARHGMAEIPDGPHSGKMLIYGGWGDQGNALTDTWLYDPAANSYELLDAAGSPTQRQGFAMAYSPSLDAVIVQGGQTNSSAGEQIFTQETWAFDHVSLSWQQVQVNSPGGDRSYHDLASDTCNGNAVMFDQPAARSVPLQPTWILK